MRFLRYLVILIAGVVIGAWFNEPLRLLKLWATRQTKGCPLAQTVRSAAEIRQNTAIKDRIVGASKLIEKDPAGYHLWETPKGRYWVTKGSDWDLPWNLAEEERDIYGRDGHGVRSGDIVLDCGANVGVFVRQSLNAGAKKVIAIEIAPGNIECLRRNWGEEIKSGRVVLYPKGVWNKEDVLTLNVPENQAAASVVMKPETAQEGPKVPLTTIDKLVKELNLERVDFIKMDIEGAEVEAIEGARETIAKYHPRMAIAAYHQPDDPVSIPAAARAAWSGYRMACGPCADAGAFVRPDVLYFYP